jgi:hypothetical protein
LATFALSRRDALLIAIRISKCKPKPTEFYDYADGRKIITKFG